METNVYADVLEISTKYEKYNMYFDSGEEWYVLFNNDYVDLIRI